MHTCYSISNCCVLDTGFASMQTACVSKEKVLSAALLHLFGRSRSTSRWAGEVASQETHLPDACQGDEALDRARGKWQCA